MSNKNEVFEYLIDQLRQQMANNPYKQQCEDLANEMQSLKNQLRDASALVAELQEELEHTGNEYRRAVDYALSDAPEQSGCRKEDTKDPGTGVVGCGREGGIKVTGAKGECVHLWHYYNDDLVHCALCGIKRSDEEL